MLVISLSSMLGKNAKHTRVKTRKRLIGWKFYGFLSCKMLQQKIIYGIGGNLSWKNDEISRQNFFSHSAYTMFCKYMLGHGTRLTYTKKFWTLVFHLTQKIFTVSNIFQSKKDVFFKLKYFIFASKMFHSNSKFSLDFDWIVRFFVGSECAKKSFIRKRLSSNYG